MKKASNSRTKNGDLAIVLLVAILVIFGTVMIFSASYYNSISEYSDPYHYLKKQLMWVGIGSVFMFCASKLDYHFWMHISNILTVVCGVLLVLVLTSLGSDAGGATRWIAVGPITIMPGEIAKAGIIVFIATLFSKDPRRAKDFWKGVVPVVAVAVIYAALILKQPNMSTAFTVIMIAGGMLLVAGIKWKHLGLLCGMAVLSGVFLIFAGSNEYREDRFTSFLDPFKDELGTGWQVVQSLLALGTGGLTGLGLGNSVQKNLYLPEAQNDFILAIIGEELGFIGILGLIIVYVILIWRGCHIAMNAKDYFGMMMASGITIMLGIQVIINIAVVTSSMPPTGIILPFISYGGNATLIFMGSMGILLNISKSSDF